VEAPNLLGVVGLKTCILCLSLAYALEVLGMHNATIVQMLCETDCDAIAGPIYRPEGVAMWSVLTFCNGLMNCLPTW
jgi:hypothetical protein